MRHDYFIKLVWPGYFTDEDRDKRIGFSSKYKNLEIPLGAKMLVYITEVQRIMALNTVTGNWCDGTRYPTTPGFPLNIPIKLEFLSEYGLSLKEVQSVVPNFTPCKDMSFLTLSEEQFIRLQKKLVNNG